MDDTTRSVPATAPALQPPLVQWGPFQLLERVGIGGFGEVYRAFDPVLQREVAVKLLLIRASEVSEEGAAVLREARSMARVIHPNVVPVYGVATHDGIVGFWTAFVRGKTFSALLQANGPFGAQEASLIGVDLCRALGAVHSARLLHRDIKPSNAMREEGGRILLMDFGLTRDGAAQQDFAGTPAYMAPELLAGHTASVASDIYAMGALLYHLLTGKIPERRTGSFSLLDARPDLPPSLARTIHTAMHEDPAKRFRSAGEMIAALSETTSLASASSTQLPPRRLFQRWTAAIAMAVVLALVASAALFYRDRISGGPASPFTSVHKDYERAHELVRHYYKPKALETAIPLLEEIVRKEPGFAAAHADLGRANFLSFWQLRDSKFAEPAKNSSLRALSLERSLASAHVTLGLLYTQQGRNDLATQELDEAFRTDRLNADAWAARAELYYRQGRNEEVEPALRKAMDLAPEDWRWPKQLGDYHSRVGNLTKAIEMDRVAVRLAPDNPRAYNNLGLDLWAAGQLGEAKTALQRAIELEPGYNRYTNLAAVLRDSGDYQSVAPLLQKAIALNPSDYRAYAFLAAAYRHLKAETSLVTETYDKAINAAEEIRKSRPREPFLLCDLGSLYADTGADDKAVPLLRQARALAPDNAEILFQAGVAFEMMHRRVDALEWIGVALTKGLPKSKIERSHDLQSFRADPNFIAMASTLR